MWFLVAACNCSVVGRLVDAIVFMVGVIWVVVFVRILVRSVCLFSKWWYRLDLVIHAVVVIFVMFVLWKFCSRKRWVVVLFSCFCVFMVIWLFFNMVFFMSNMVFFEFMRLCCFGLGCAIVFGECCLGVCLFG